MSEKNTIAVVTGANRGIGFELCRQLKERGVTVLAFCRKSSEELDTLGVEVHAGIDVADDGCMEVVKKAIDGRPVHLLINNAGILRRESIGEMSFESMREQYEVNSLGPLRVTRALLKNYPKGAKIGLVTSRMGSIADNTSGSRYGYRMSKAALNIAGVSLAHDLKQREVAVAILHPGFVRTGMTDNQGFIDAPDAAAGLLQRMDDSTLETSGGFWHSNGERLPW